MKSSYKLLGLFTVLAPLTAHGQYTYQWGHPAAWGSPQNIGSDTLGSFESLALPSGVQVSVTTPAGSYGPTSTLPNLFRTTFDGTIYAQGRYDGDHAFLNTLSNQSGDSWDYDRVGDLTLSFTTPVSKVGFSMGNMRPGSKLWINGIDQGEFLPKFSSLLTGEYGRQGYFTISGPAISSLTLDVDYGDTLVIDHLIYSQAVPEPASMIALSLGAAALLRRRRRK